MTSSFHLHFVSMSVSPELYVCVPHACSGWGSKKQASDTLELKLQLCLSHHVGTGHRKPKFSTSAANAFNHRAGENQVDPKGLRQPSLINEPQVSERDAVSKKKIVGP